MDIVRSLIDPLLEGYSQGVVAVGNFDGVHLGHQALLSECYRRAVELSSPAIVLTFEPHPREILPRPNFPNGEAAEHFRLTNFDQKCTEFERLNFDLVVALEFNAEFAALTPEIFCQTVFAQALNPELVVVGSDFCFGAKRAGTTQILQEIGKKYGFLVETIEKRPATQQADAKPYSSTEIRRLIAAGEMTAARNCLGRAWAIQGVVTKGDQRGRTIGFPTANIFPVGIMQPKFGVYAVRVKIRGDQQIYHAVANYGVRPTVNGAEPRLEAHIFAFDQDIYGQLIDIEMIDFIRDEKRFSGLPELVEQIKLDALRATEILDGNFKGT